MIHQNYPNLEYILIDGGSTDETMTVVNRDQKYFSDVVSEADEAQSHAINKGLRQATGDIVTWLNSDERFAPGGLYAAALAFYTMGNSFTNPKSYSLALSGTELGMQSIKMWAIFAAAGTKIYPITYPIAQFPIH